MAPAVQPTSRGASFLTDNILGLVIDYDELRTGTRSEATFTMFASFIPKVGRSMSKHRSGKDRCVEQMEGHFLGSRGPCLCMSELVDQSLGFE